VQRGKAVPFELMPVKGATDTVSPGEVAVKFVFVVIK